MRSISLLLGLLWCPLSACGGGGSTGADPIDSGQENAMDAGTLDPPDPGTPDASNPQHEGITWHADIAPILFERCVGCHREGGIAPFSLQTYAQAAPFGEAIALATAERTMPPWGAQDTEECKPRHGFQDDVRLTNQQIQLIQDWVEAGAAEGDAQDAAELPPPTTLELTSRDVRLTIPKPITVSGTSDRFVCFSIDPELDADKWLVATQVNPGNPAIVHHVLTYLDKGGTSAALVDQRGYYDCFGGPGVEGADLVAAWAPGGVPVRTPENVALEIPAGSRLVVNVHYHPTGAGDEVDAETSIDLEFSEIPPKYEARLALIGNFDASDPISGLLDGPSDPTSGAAFLIPAGAEDHTETMRFVVPPLVPRSYIWSIGTHMHYVGTDMKIELSRSDPRDQPKEECLIQTPAWDFNWQRGYAYDAPLSELPTVGVGDRLTLRCTYNNSTTNPFVREALADQGLKAPRDVELGEETLDEMCLGVFGIAFPRGAGL